MGYEASFMQLFAKQKGFTVDSSHAFPECRQHPSRQVEFAKHIIKHARKEHKRQAFIIAHENLNQQPAPTVVLTMSDFLVKEINNLIMAKHAGGTAKRTGYTPDMFLDADEVEAWIVHGFNEASLVQIDPKYGIEESAFDDEIRRIDDAANALASGIELMEK